MPPVRRKTYNFMVWWWADFWRDFVESDPARRAALLAAFPRFGAKGDLDQLSKQIRMAAQDAHQKLEEKQIKDAATLSYAALVCQELLRRESADRKAELGEKIEGRRLMMRAWRVIKNFERSQRRESPRVRENFTAKILRLAQEKKMIFARAARKAENTMLKNSYRSLAREIGPQDHHLGELLSQLDSNPSSVQPLSKLRRYFYVTAESPRRIFRRYPRLTSYRYPRVYRDLEVFNLVCYFRFACGLSPTAAYWLTNFIVHPRRLNLPKSYSVSARFRRFAHRFCPLVLTHVRRA